ncbi:hypothetical protein E2562_008271 [Oryza meyeriana var. granulata]|uniref:Uncharacterized protein n=1 Tax=Oryza meyeriana var. granulata TaxID=110450 RepID=A0A6G1DFJ1_9ORYZ|nr:hypothetical protein E2562_008271 [Oryza meyeriana var. granulata]
MASGKGSAVVALVLVALLCGCVESRRGSSAGSTAGSDGGQGYGQGGGSGLGLGSGYGEGGGYGRGSDNRSGLGFGDGRFILMLFSFLIIAMQRATYGARAAANESSSWMKAAACRHRGKSSSGGDRPAARESRPAMATNYRSAARGGRRAPATYVKRWRARRRGRRCLCTPNI